MITNYRSNFLRLANSLLDDGDSVRANEVVAYAMKQIPESTIPMDLSADYLLTELFKRMHKDKEVVSLLEKTHTSIQQYLTYYSAEGRTMDRSDYDRKLELLKYVFQEYLRLRDYDKAEKIADELFSFTREDQYQKAVARYKKRDEMMDSLKLNTDTAPDSPKK